MCDKCFRASGTSFQVSLRPQNQFKFRFSHFQRFDPIFRKNLTGASILEWSKGFDPPSVSEEIIDVEKEASLQVNER